MWSALVRPVPNMSSSVIAGWTKAFRWSFVLCLVLWSGCNGCRKPIESLSQEERQKLAKEKLDAIETKQPSALPADFQSAAITLKAGHWVETTQSMKSNQEDLQILVTGDVLLGTDQVPISGTNIVNEYARATALPKGQSRNVNLQYFIPRSGSQQDSQNFVVDSKIKLRTRLLSRPLLSPLKDEPFIVNELNAEQFELVVLTPEPLVYEYLGATDFVLWRGEELLDAERVRSYHVTLMNSVNGKFAMPSSLLTMTSTAVVVWDDVAPEELSAEQKYALLDWLHWGGQLIISGPNSWSRLQNSFLVPYLPVNSGQAVELTTPDFSPISAKWAVEDLARRERDPLRFEGAAIPGLKFGLASEGMWLPHTGQLVAERSVGRGRVVITSFPLREPRIYRWQYFSNFFSTGILRRPARTVQRSGDLNSRQQRWAAPYQNMESDPRLNSNLRIASRDVPLSAHSATFAAQSGPEALFNDPQQNQGLNSNALDEPRPSPPSELPSDSLEQVQWSDNGVAWNDFSGLGFQAIQSLRAAAGIDLPKRATIIWLITVYLACLVPLNWLIFRLVGRLELAWLAAPIIAVVGVVVVTKVASLDIGFASRTTELSCLELYANYPRAHLTRYFAIYTSLSTNYAVDLPDPGSVALPLGDVARFQLRSNAARRNLRTSYGESPGMRLEPLTVFSNSTEMVHAEQMVEFTEGIQYQTDGTSNRATIVNGTGLSLQSCLFVRRLPSGVLQMAWQDQLTAAQPTMLEFKNALWEDLPRAWNRSPITRIQNSASQASDAAESQPSITTDSTLAVGNVLWELVNKVPLVPGQTRLFCFTDHRPGKLTIKPQEDQLDSRCVVMAHLTPMILPDLTPDQRILSRVGGPVDPLESSNKNSN